MYSTTFSRYGIRSAIRFFILIPAVFFTILSGCGKTPTSGNTIRISASIVPLADFCRKVGGSAVEVDCVVPPGVNPHVFDFTPEKLIAASKADLLVMNGAGLEFWADKVRDASGGRDDCIVTTSAGVKLEKSHHGELGNPHVWLDPVSARRAVEIIRDALVRIDPARAKSYTENARVYLDSLSALDAWIQAKTQSWSTKSFISFHSSWVYFANRYGLVQEAVLEDQPGQEISPATLASITDLVRAKHIRLLIAEPQFSQKSIQLLGTETGAKIVVLDALGSPATSLEYIPLMRHNVELLDAVLR